MNFHRWKRSKGKKKIQYEEIDQNVFTESCESRFLLTFTCTFHPWCNIDCVTWKERKKQWKKNEKTKIKKLMKNFYVTWPKQNEALWISSTSFACNDEISYWSKLIAKACLFIIIILTLSIALFISPNKQ